jgi:hypothetical protein
MSVSHYAQVFYCHDSHRPGMFDDSSPGEIFLVGEEHHFLDYGRFAT